MFKSIRQVFFLLFDQYDYFEGFNYPLYIDSLKSSIYLLTILRMFLKLKMCLVNQES